jgi:Holliday junction DNA helicase RuvA
MLAYLRGTLQSRDITGGPADRIVIDVSGVGFELTVSKRTALSCGDLGDTVTVHTAVSIRETEWTIFGFASREEREMFALLQSVSGVGPKLALALVGTLGSSQIADAVIAEDHKLLSQAPGVGTKVAQRIILELRPKMEEWSRGRGLASGGPAQANEQLDEARAILEGLGYTLTEINMAFKKAQEESVADDVEILVRHSLKLLGAAGR